MLSTQDYKKFVKEDLPQGDITTNAVCSEKRNLTAKMIAKSDLVVSGLKVAQDFSKNTFPKIKWTVHRKDGSAVKAGTKIATLKGPAADLLQAERVILNIIQHLAGISTLTASCVTLAKPHGIQILDTRKTMPGWRDEQRMAVQHGGGANHRLNLSTQYLIKENHIRQAGSLYAAIEACYEHRMQTKSGHLIEVEVTDFDEFEEALAWAPEIILLDNMTPAQIKKCVTLRNKVVSPRSQVLLEISGGVTVSNLKKYLKTGVDRISMGSLTHSAPVADVSLLF